LHPSFPGKKTAERRSYRRRSGRVSSFSLGASKMMCNFRGLGAGSSDLQIFPAFCLGFRMISIYFIEKNWLVVFRHPSEKYEFVSWDDDIPNRWKNRIHVPNHQPESIEPEKTINHVLTNGY